MNPNASKTELEDPAETRRWKRVYVIVLIYTAFLIAGLWGLSQIYT